MRYDNLALGSLTTLKRLRREVVLLRKPFNGSSIRTNRALHFVFRIEPLRTNILD